MMKKVKANRLLLPVLVTLACYLLTNYQVASQTIPWATQQPAWVFPLYFEEGNGQKDTIYFGYHSNASLGSGEPADTIYGEKLIKIDTTKFHALWASSSGYCGGNLCDSVRKADVAPSDFDAIKGETISFMNGVYPVKVKWDLSLLYSDSLPFSDNDPLPRAQGEFWYGAPGDPDDQDTLNCSISEPILLTDTTDSMNAHPCTVKIDSMVFKDLWGRLNQPITGFRIEIRPWQGTWANINEAKKGKYQIRTYPNPSFGTMTLESNNFIIQNVEIYDLTGKKVYSYKAGDTGQKRISLNINELNRGLYLLVAHTHDHIKFVQKLAIQ